MRQGITDTVKHLLIINVLMFIGTMTVGNGLFYEWFAMFFPKNDSFQPWQVITHMFMHGGPAHILFNMFALWMFGTPVEQQLGTKKFLFIYLSAGLGAVLFQLGYYYYDYINLIESISSLNIDRNLLDRIMNIDSSDGVYLKRDLFIDGLIPILEEFKYQGNLNANDVNSLFRLNAVVSSTMVGASGCIMGVLAAFGVMNPNAKLMLIFLPIPIKAKYFIPGIIILDLISAISGQSFFSPSNTAYMAHVGGAIVGFIIMWYWKKNSMDKYRWN